MCFSGCIVTHIERKPGERGAHGGLRTTEPRGFGAGAESRSTLDGPGAAAARGSLPAGHVRNRRPTPW